jgi:hypothetical protein
MAGDATDLKLACHENFDLVRSWRPRDHFWRIAAPVQSVEIPVRPYTPISSAALARRRFFDRGLSGSEEVTRFEAEHPLRLG